MLVRLRDVQGPQGRHHLGECLTDPAKRLFYLTRVVWWWYKRSCTVIAVITIAFVIGIIRAVIFVRAVQCRRYRKHGQIVIQESSHFSLLLPGYPSLDLLR